MRSPLGDGAHCDDPSQVTGNTSSSQWECHESAEAKPPGASEIIEMISYENRILTDMMMGVETPIPPIARDAAAPKGAPRRLQLPVSRKPDWPLRASKNLMVLLPSHSCGIRRPVEALRRGAILPAIFMVLGGTPVHARF